MVKREIDTCSNKLTANVSVAIGMAYLFFCNLFSVV